MEPLLPYFVDIEEEITQSKDPKRSKEFWSKLAWDVESCHEADQLFPDMIKCPVCMGEVIEGVTFHRGISWN